MFRVYAEADVGRSLPGGKAARVQFMETGFEVLGTFPLAGSAARAQSAEPEHEVLRLEFPGVSCDALKPARGVFDHRRLCTFENGAKQDLTDVNRIEPDETDKSGSGSHVKPEGSAEGPLGVAVEVASALRGSEACGDASAVSRVGAAPETDGCIANAGQAERESVNMFPNKERSGTLDGLGSCGSGDVHGSLQGNQDSSRATKPSGESGATGGEWAALGAELRGYSDVVSEGGSQSDERTIASSGSKPDRINEERTVEGRSRGVEMLSIEASESGRTEEARLVLLRCHPLTGRTHQIRLHCLFVGLPLVGDARYGGLLEIGGKEQAAHCLHAETLAFEHPFLQTPLCIRAPNPAWADSFT